MEEHWILLRGLSRESAHGAPFLKAFTQALPGVQAHSIDLPGAGVNHQALAPRTVDELMESVRAEALARVPTGARVYIFSISLGGMLTIAWTAKHPREVAGVVLTNSSVGGLSPFWHRMRPSALPKVVRAAASRSIEARERLILGVVSNRTDLHERTLEEWVKIQNARPVTRRNTLSQLLAAARYRLPRELPAVPALVLIGEGDQLVHPSCSRKLAARFSASLSSHPTAGHDLTTDEPEWTAREVARWRRGLL
jgi:pimeloyl-ACP methyl ester carboxylesterase